MTIASMSNLLNQANNDPNANKKCQDTPSGPMNFSLKSVKSQRYIAASLAILLSENQNNSLQMERQHTDQTRVKQVRSSDYCSIDVLQFKHAAKAHIRRQKNLPLTNVVGIFQALIRKKHINPKVRSRHVNPQKHAYSTNRNEQRSKTTKSIQSTLLAPEAFFAMAAVSASPRKHVDGFWNLPR